MAGNDQHDNRSSALTPEALAVMNSAIAKAVQESVSAIFANLKPTLESMAITPEKLREANRPYEDPKRAERDARETKKSKADEAELRQLTAARRAACPHLDANGRSSINLVHNQPDHQPRGICVTCGDWIFPKEWRIGPPDDQNPRGRAFLVEPHKDYKIVMSLESRQ